MIQQISDSELELMKIIWAKEGRALYAEIMDTLLENGFKWQKNTVITLLSRLVEKGLLKTSKIGRKNQYTAVVTESAYQAFQTRVLIDKIYEGNVKGLVTTLLEKDFMSENDYRELKEYWERGQKHE